MRKIITIFAVFFIGVVAFLLGKSQSNYSISPISLKELQPKPLNKYAILNLKNTQFEDYGIKFGNEITNTPTFKSRIFYFYTKSLTSGRKLKVSGLINIPKNIQTPLPIIILIRGYVDQKIYQTGVGTQRVGEFLAEKGFLTLSPDFLGYGKSDMPSINSLEERFQTYTTILSLLSSVKSLNKNLISQKMVERIDTNRIGIWAHSNGGQIALTVLEIINKKIPTVLWAPVSKPFPYSILYYTDEYTDNGKALRKVIANFEENYDVNQFSLTEYLGFIKSPISLHQGTNDLSIPTIWSNDLYQKLTKTKVTIDYFTYEGADHNLMPNGWLDATNKSLIFFQKSL